MNRNIAWLASISILAFAGAGHAAPAYAELNLQCFDSASKDGKKHYSLFWLNPGAGTITIGAGTGGANEKDAVVVAGISRTLPLKVTPQAFSFENNGAQEKISKETGIYTAADGKQERCWKGNLPLPAGR